MTEPTRTAASAWTFTKLVWREPLLLFLFWLGVMAELARGRVA